MKKTLLSIVLILLVATTFVSYAEAKTVRVKSYYKPSTGRFVMPSYRSSPNKSLFDNYSTKGNYNPYTGKKGYVNPYRW